MTEIAVQTVNGEILLQDMLATCYVQIYFITVINADFDMFTFIARDCFIEIMKDTDCSLDQKGNFIFPAGLLKTESAFETARMLI